jgi:hypothetical protein
MGQSSQPFPSVKISEHFSTTEQTKGTRPAPDICGLIISQAKNAFQSQSTHSIFLAGYKPHSGKTGFQGHPCTIKDDACCYRDLASALPTMKMMPTGRLWIGFSAFKGIG